MMYKIKIKLPWVNGTFIAKISLSLSIRFHSFLLYLGYSRSMVRETSADAFCKTISDFALEYRATHHAILQQREREREREEKEDERIRKTSTSTPKAKAIESPAPVRRSFVLSPLNPRGNENTFLYLCTRSAWCDLSTHSDIWCNTCNTAVIQVIFLQLLWG